MEAAAWPIAGSGGVMGRGRRDRWPQRLSARRVSGLQADGATPLHNRSCGRQPRITTMAHKHHNTPQVNAVAESPSAMRISDFYTPFPRQKEFHESPAKYRLFGGAAGPGKTKALLWEAIRQAQRPSRAWIRCCCGARFRSWRLRCSVISGATCRASLYKSYNDSKHVVTWLNGSTTRFGYSASEIDIYQYQGAEFLFIGIDELTLFTLGQWQFLTSRNRCPHADAQPNMAGATNPGNIGHAWVKALWVDRRPAPGMDRPGNTIRPITRSFARRWRTTRSTGTTPDYRKTLDALPRHLRQAFLIRRLERFRRAIFRSIRRAAAYRARRAAGHRAVVAAVDLGGLGIRASQRGVLARGAPRRRGGDVSRVRRESSVAAHAGAGHRRSVSTRSADGDALRARSAEVYLSPDAFARRTSESTIAEQLGDVLAQNGLAAAGCPPTTIAWAAGCCCTRCWSRSSG